MTRAGNIDYAYDLNGNMASSAFVDTSAPHRSFAWSSFNKPVRMENAVTGAASEFVYGPSRARVKQTELAGAAVVKTTTYIGGDFERVAPAAGADELVHYIRAGGERVAIFTKIDDGAPATDKTRYLHKDHLGSIDLVTDEAGLAADTRSFDPWGLARNPDWTPMPGGAALAETPRGFTDHEHIQTVGLIHMNGRVQDPVTGRFISPDPSDALNPGVGFNRYSYALNNPLSYTDPSGFEIGDRFGTPEEAGVDAVAEINPLSIEVNLEYAGTIEREVTPVMDENGNPVLNEDGTPIENVDYYATDPVAGTTASGTVFGDEDTTVGMYHTHGDYSTKDPEYGGPIRVDPNLPQNERKALDQFDGDSFAPQDKITSAAVARGTARARARYGETFRSYLGTPSGEIKVETPSQEDQDPPDEDETPEHENETSPQ